MKHQLKKIFAIVGLTVAFVSVSQAQTYSLAGVFNGWNASANPMTAGPNAGEWSYTITGGTPGAYDLCKVTDGTWSFSWPTSGNLLFLYDSTGSATIHFWPGSTTDGWLPLANRVGYDDPNNDPGWSLAGSFNSWGTAANLTAIGSGVYSNSIVDTSGQPSGTYKFQSPQNSWADINFANPDFGNGNGNGSYPLTSNPQTLPVVLDLPDGRFYVGAPATPPTNTVTFQLDMSEQVAFGNFTNTDPNTMLPVNSVAVGGFNGDWGTDQQLTNYTILNPGDLNPGNKTNLYIGTFATQGYLPITFNWKFRVNNLDGGYEQPVSTTGGNRTTTLTQQNTTLPVISYDDLGLGDLVLSPITVTFSLFLTNGTPDDTGYQFIKGTDFPYIAGPWAPSAGPSGWGWGYNSMPASQEMVEVGTSDVYTNSFVFPRGASIYVTYKYGYNGVDDENGVNTNHVREIRSYGPTYSFPQDVWSWTVLQPGNGNPYPNPGIASTNIVEPDFGYLAIGAPTGGNFPITWLGRPAVMLQNASSLLGPWNTIGATDATQATNWPNAGGNQFFRLIKN
jgi:hypothetical protein